MQQMADTLVNKLRSRDKSKYAKYDIAKDLMKDAVKCTKYAMTCHDILDNLTKVVRKGTFVSKEFMELVDNELKVLRKE